MHIRTLTALVVLALALSACGGTVADDSGAADGTLSAPADATTTTSTATPTSTVESVEPSTSTTSASDARSKDDASSDSAATRDSTPDDPEDVPGETVPTTDPVRTIGDVPQAYLDAVMNDASSKTDSPIATLTVLRAEYVEWSDGSLGCPEPGMVYTQAVTPGYWIEIAAGDRTLDYRVGEAGTFRLCGGATTPHGDAGSGDASDPAGDG